MQRFSELLRLTLASMVAGALIGLLGGGFRYLLSAADRLRSVMIIEAHASSIVGFTAVLFSIAVAAALARWLVVRFAPITAGSGVQYVEAMVRGEAKPAGAIVIPVKFIGGLIAIGAGLALGREGPTVQMGAALGTVLSTRIMADAPDRSVVDAAGAGAGLAVAFNAPIGGSIFVFEELTRSFTPRLVIATVGAAAVAIAVMRLMLGDTQEFAAGLPEHQPIGQLPFFVLLGALVGLAGAGYNALTLALLFVTDRMAAVPSVFRAGAIGLVVAAVGWFAPALIGGGDALVQGVLNADFPVIWLALILAARMAIGPLCYAAGTPGGLFAPLLAVGSAAGALFANVLLMILPDAQFSPVAFAVVGMAALFTAVVRAPLTGMVLTIEMTGRADLALAMLCACLSADLCATAVGSEPIYDSLRRRMIAGVNATAGAAAAQPRQAATTP